MLLKIPPCSTQSKNPSLDLCFEPRFCWLWGRGSSPVGVQGSTVLLPPGACWDPWQLPWVGAVTRAGQLSSCTAQQHPEQLPVPPACSWSLSWGRASSQWDQGKLAGQCSLLRESLPEEVSLQRNISSRLHTPDGFSGAAWQGHGLGRGEGNETPQLCLPFSLPREQWIKSVECS